MKNKIFRIIIVLLAFTSCKEEIKEVKKEKPEDLIEIKNGVFTQYYPGKKAIKFQGNQTKKGERNGKWVFYAENGNEQSITFFKDGKKHGHSIVKYPSGIVYYVGEYYEDKKIGVWKTFDTKGDLMQEKDFGTIE